MQMIEKYSDGVVLCETKVININTEYSKIVNIINSIISSSENTPLEILEKVLFLLLDILGCDCAKIYCNSAANPEVLHCIKSVETADFDFIRDTRYKSSDRTLLIEAFTDHKILLSKNISEDPRENFINKDVSFLGIPLKNRHTSVGQISFFSKDLKILEFEKVFCFMDLLVSILSKTNYDKISSPDELSLVAESVQEKDIFLAAISHELRTPFNGIVGILELFPKAGNLNEKQREYIDHISICTSQLLTLLNNLLDYGKLINKRIALNLSNESLENVIDSSIKMVEKHYIDKNLDFQLSVENLPENIMIDKQRTIQIITNVLSNAIRFTDEGYVKMKVYGKFIPSKTKIKTWKIIFEVKDTGIGISPSDHQIIFNPYERSENITKFHESSGTGLGLSITKQLTKLMDGNIEVKSEGIPGKGSLFKFYIMAEENFSNHVDYSLLSGKRVLIVDDNEGNRLVLTDMIFDLGMLPITLPSAEEALRYLERDDSINIALIDICMPFMSGIELAQIIRKKYNHINLIALSSLESSPGVDFFDHYLYKPIQKNSILSCIIDSLEQSSQGPYSDSYSEESIISNRSSLSILVAEDNPSNKYTISEQLKELGYTNFNIASNGKECVDEVSRDPLKYNVILMDIIMPVMNGYDATRIIRKMPKKPIIVALSAAAQKSDKQRGQMEGISYYLTKPLCSEDLVNILDTFID